MTHQDLRDTVFERVGPGAFQGGAELSYTDDGRPTIDVIGTRRKYVAGFANGVVQVEYGSGARIRWGYLNENGSISGGSSRLGSRDPEMN